MIRLVNTCHHIKLLQNYWLHSLCCVLHPHDVFITGSAYLFILFSDVALPPLLWWPPVCSLYLQICACFVYSFIYFSYISEIMHYLSCSVWLISLSVILSAAAAAKSLQLYPTLCHPADCSPPGSSVHGILQARMLEWVPMPSSRGSSRLRNWTHISYVSCIGRRLAPHG